MAEAAGSVALRDALVFADHVSKTTRMLRSVRAIVGLLLLALACGHAGDPPPPRAVKDEAPPTATSASAIDPCVPLPKEGAACMGGAPHPVQRHRGRQPLLWRRRVLPRA